MTHFKSTIVGLSGAGKTSLLTTVSKPAVVAAEAGFAALAGVDEAGKPMFDGRVYPVQTPEELERTLTWMAGKPFGIAKPNEAFGAALYAEVCEQNGGTWAEANGGVLPLVGIDSLTDISRRMMQRAERSPETLTKGGARDGFAVFGKAKNDVEWLIGTFMDLYDGDVVVLAVADIVDDPVLGRQFIVKSDTKKAAGSVLEKGEATLYLGVGNDPDHGEFRYLRSRIAPAGVPGHGLALKDRTGTLNEIEPPDLSVLIEKFRSGKRVRPLQRGLPPSLQ